MFPRLLRLTALPRSTSLCWSGWASPLSSEEPVFLVSSSMESLPFPASLHKKSEIYPPTRLPSKQKVWYGMDAVAKAIRTL